MRRFPLRIAVLVCGLTCALVCAQAQAVTWFPFGPDGGDARSFAADPTDHLHLYLGTANGWIYQSQDGGKKWTRRASIGRRDDLVIDHIIVDPTDAKHLVAGAWVVADLQHPDGGLFISHDGGATWTSQAEMRGQSVRALAIAPSDAKTMVAGTIKGVYRSTDGGEHWQQISSKDVYELASVAIDPVDPKTIYAGTWHLPWKTTDGGATWTSIKDGIIEDSDVFSILVDPKQSNVVYASACSGIYKSDDAGAKFTKAGGIPSDARRTRVLRQDPNHLDTVFAGTTLGLYRTDDGGKLWTQTTGADHIVNDVYVDPADPKRVLLATDREGVLASDDGGVSFMPSNGGFSARHIEAYVQDAQHPATVYVGVLNDKEWGGVFVSHTGGVFDSSWTQLPAGLDGQDVFSLGQAPDGTILAGTGHGIYRLKGGAWERVGAPGAAIVVKKGAAGKAAARPVAARPVAKGNAGAGSAGTGKTAGWDGIVYGFAVTGQTIYAGTSEGMLRSVSNGAKWEVVSTIPADEWRFVAASKQSVVAASLHAVEVSADGGATWQAVALPAKVTEVTAAALDVMGRVWVGGREGAFYSADNGKSWQTLKDLYVRNVNSIYFDAAGERMLVTSNGPATEAFAVQLATMRIEKWDTGWSLRFVRPVGDHLIAGTLFDGIVVQPKMVESPEPAETRAAR